MAGAFQVEARLSLRKGSRRIVKCRAASRQGERVRKWIKHMSCVISELGCQVQNKLGGVDVGVEERSKVASARADVSDNALRNISYSFSAITASYSFIQVNTGYNYRSCY